jgi:hypothetical protein
MSIPTGFRRKRIDISIHDDLGGGTQPVYAVVRGALAVHRSVARRDQFNVTHIPTGRLIVWFRQRSDAISEVRRLERMVDWRHIRKTPKGRVVGAPKAALARVHERILALVI